VGSKWYDGLMGEVSDAEMMTMLNTMKAISAPGEDGIGGGLWKVLCSSDMVRTCVARFITACLRVRIMPSLASVPSFILFSRIQLGRRH